MNLDDWKWWKISKMIWNREKIQVLIWAKRLKWIIWMILLWVTNKDPSFFRNLKLHVDFEQFHENLWRKVARVFCYNLRYQIVKINNNKLIRFDQSYENEIGVTQTNVLKKCKELCEMTNFVKKLQKFGNSADYYRDTW